jgi:hypothetical protein
MIAPSCIATSKSFVKSSLAIPKNELAMIMWPVEEIGKNSVKPSTIAIIIESKIDISTSF